MNSEVMHSRVQLDEPIRKQLMTEVKETVATDVAFTRAPKNSFSALNLWSLRRSGRFSASTRKQPAIINGFGY